MLGSSCGRSDERLRTAIQPRSTVWCIHQQKQHHSVLPPLYCCSAVLYTLLASESAKFRRAGRHANQASQGHLNSIDDLGSSFLGWTPYLDSRRVFGVCLCECLTATKVDEAEARGVLVSSIATVVCLVEDEHLCMTNLNC